MPDALGEAVQGGISAAHRHRKGARFLWVAPAVLLALVALLLLTDQGRVAIKTALFVPQVLPSSPVHPQEWFAPEPMRYEVHFPQDGGEGIADLYRPARPGRYGAVLLFLGVNPAGRDDTRIVNLGKALARAGMVVMVPWSEGMAEKRVEPQEIERLVAAFQYLRGLELVDRNRVGMGGFCVGASLALVAAADASIRDQVAFVNFFGGYYDATDLIRQTASRTSFYGDATRPWEPGDLTREVVTWHLIAGLSNPAEREALTRAFVSGGSGAALDVSSLSQEASAAYFLLKGVSLEEARSYTRQLPAATQDLLRRISPSSYVGDLRARVLIMHDREDDLIPSQESRRLADALESRGNVYYTDFSFFQHMDPTRPVGRLTFAREAMKLFLHMFQVLRAGA
ncbi:MAG: dienelactone hydrolase family protein [Chloroflexi bacterium]|nr:dienelactone hydrolase family protein [Chloroflexota bacterium]